MEGLIENGSDHLEPLLDFRDWLQAIRNHPDYRQNERRNGKPGVGPFTLDARRRILDRLLTTQTETGMPLISDEEVNRIYQLWSEDTVTAANRLFDEYRKVSQNEDITTSI